MNQEDFDFSMVHGDAIAAVDQLRHLLDVLGDIANGASQVGMSKGATAGVNKLAVLLALSLGQVDRVDTLVDDLLDAGRRAFRPSAA